MKFIQQVLTIKDITTDTRQVIAWVGEGTGLAYVQTVDADHNLMPDTYNLMHASSGYALPFLVSSEAEAQTYLEKVANIFADKWNCDLASIKKRDARKGSRLLAKIELAHYDSLAPHVDYFLYAATTDDVFTESHTDAADKDPGDVGNQKIAEQLLTDYPEATKVIMASVADADGIHHILRTFERAAAAQI